MFGFQPFGQRPFGQQQSTGGFNSSQGNANTNNMNNQSSWPASFGGFAANFNNSSSPQSPASASEHTSFSGFSTTSYNSPNTSYTSSPYSPASRDCSPFVTAFQASVHDNPFLTPTKLPFQLPTPPPSENRQPGSHIKPTAAIPFHIPSTLPIPPTPNFLTPCARCANPLPIGHRPLSCGHSTCASCTRSLVIESLVTAAAGQPFAEARCCGATPVPLTIAGSVLDHNEFEAYRARLHEQATPVAERRYCHEPRCGMFLMPERVRSGTCALCRDRTCTRCGRKSHRNPCDEGQAFQNGMGFRPWLAEY